MRSLEEKAALFDQAEAMLHEIDLICMPDQRGHRRRNAINKITDLVMTRPWQHDHIEVIISDCTMVAGFAAEDIRCGQYVTWNVKTGAIGVASPEMIKRVGFNPMKREGNECQKKP